MRGPLCSADDLAVSEILGFRVIPADERRTLGRHDFASTVRERIGQRPVFLSFDVDFLGIRLAGADVVEVAPAYGGPGQATSIAAANITWELLALRAAGGEPSSSV
jgi:agmatinase